MLSQLNIKEDYRRYLMQQMKIKDRMRNLGEMSEVERQLNRKDLDAYNNGQAQVSLVPGLKSQVAISGDKEVAKRRA